MKLLLLILLVCSPLHAGELTANEQAYLHQAQLAAHAALAIYKLENVHGRTGPAMPKFLADFNKFMAATPPGYEIYATDADVRSGMKFAVYYPLPTPPLTAVDPETPWILAIGGTDGLIDALADAALGKPQFDRILAAVRAFGLKLIGQHSVIITGHSLGGGLAQALSHEIIAMSHRDGIPHRKVYVFSWNGFGAQDLIRRGGNYHPEYADELEVHDYFVRGDIVSRVGTYFGPSYELVSRDRPLPHAANGRYTLQENSAETIRVHGIMTINQMIDANPAILLDAPSALPPSLGSLERITQVSWVLEGVNSFIHDVRRPHIAKWIADTLNAVKPKSLQNKSIALALQYVYNVGFTEWGHIRKENAHRKESRAKRLAEAEAQLLQGALDRYRSFAPTIAP